MSIDPNDSNERDYLPSAPSSIASTNTQLSKMSLLQQRIHSGTNNVKNHIYKKIPILSWLIFEPGYNWKDDLTQDIFAGATISAVIIPQSMAYAMLASMPPVHGLYTSLVSPALYAVFGTSRHMSTGTFAISSLLLGQFAHKILLEQGFFDSSPGSEYQRRYLPLCFILTFFAGFIQILFSMARLGRLISKHLLPIALVSGFNTASAFHIGTHQLKHLMGMYPPREGGVFSMIKTWIWFIQHVWDELNWPSLGLGIAAMVLMYILQQIEYCRRNRSDQPIRPPFFGYPSPAPSPASGTFPSPTFNISPYFDPSSRSYINYPSNSNRANTQFSDQHERCIVPNSVSDQALLTAQDVALGNEDMSCDSSPRWTPEPSPNLESIGDGVITNHTLSSPTSQTSFAENSRSPVNSTTFGNKHISSSPGTAGLTNTGAFGHRQERVRQQKLSPSNRNYRYKTFRTPGVSSNNTKIHLYPGSEDEQEPLVPNNNRTASNRVSTRRSLELPSVAAAVAYDSDQYLSSSSASSAVFNRNEGYQQQQQHRGEGGQESSIYQKQAPSRLSRFIPKVHFPIPDIFICVVVFTVATIAFNLDERYLIDVIGYIPTGLPTVSWPLAMTEGWSSNDWTLLIWPSFLLAVIIYVMSLSVAKYFGREYGYEIDADQELLALGAGSLVGSCFGGYVCTGNLTRSAILAQLGAKTPLASLVGAFMVLMTLLWFTALFERIPNTVLAAIVLVALRSLLVHTVEAKRLWRIGRRKDAFIWWITFISVFIFSIEVGLGVGMSVVVLLKVYKHGTRWKRAIVRDVKKSAPYQRIMQMLGLQSPLFTTSGRGLYNGDEDDDY
ncbi:hypothetical protein BGZ76_002685 [Entomortierella beljakovae]|nr:hypothetical protein BGZ76_002685 [Entomortierella beljakovae]